MVSDIKTSRKGELRMRVRSLRDSYVGMLVINAMPPDVMVKFAIGAKKEEFSVGSS